LPSILDALLLIGNGSEKFAMQVQVKNFRHESAELRSRPQKPSSITVRRIVVLLSGRIPVSRRSPCRVEPAGRERQALGLDAGGRIHAGGGRASDA
jgi:hypothetical protein